MELIINTGCIHNNPKVLYKWTVYDKIGQINLILWWRVKYDKIFE